MPDTFGTTADTFIDLCEELRLENGRSVTKELQLAMFLLIVKGGTLHLRLISDRVQRAKDTISKYFKVVLSRLVDRAGFYTKYVGMPSASAPVSRFIQENSRFPGYFDNCIGAVDGTHVPIL